MEKDKNKKFEKKEEKTIYNMELHEMLKIEDDGKEIEVTKVPGGWIYVFEFPGYRQLPAVFVPKPSIPDGLKK
jgi:hypothetical protein